MKGHDDHNGGHNDHNVKHVVCIVVRRGRCDRYLVARCTDFLIIYQDCDLH